MVTEAKITGFTLKTEDGEDATKATDELPLTPKDGSVTLVLKPTTPDGKATVLKELRFTVDEVTSLEYIVKTTSGELDPSGPINVSYGALLN